MRRRFRIWDKVLASGVAISALAYGTTLALGTSGVNARDRESLQAIAFSNIDGTGHNLSRPLLGAAGQQYIRIARSNYSDGKSAIVPGPNARYVSNRVFNDIGQNFFDEHNVSQWGWAWGQFLDHDFGLRDENPGDDLTIPTVTDPIEQFQNNLGGIQMARTPAAPGTGTFGPRQQINTVTSYIDGSQVYGSDAVRNAWLRDGAKLLLPDDYLPHPGDKPGAPSMDLMGRLTGHPDVARIAGDVRANENISLTSIQTLFAREHNRIVDELPDSLSDDVKFAFARKIVGAEIQYVTYNEFLPALGLQLSRYRGFKSWVNPTLSNEFATVGYRAHSMVHGQFDVTYEDGDYAQEQLDAFVADGVVLGEEDGELSLQIPLSVAFGNPDLMQTVGLGPVLISLGQERQYQNDEQIDNTMRSILFEFPKPSAPDPGICQVPVVDPNCFAGIADLGAIDLVRARDHGIPLYNDLRRAYGLRRVRSFTEITGESTDALPPGKTIDDPSIMDFTSVTDADGNELVPLSPEALEDGVHGTRVSTLAARLKAIYGSVDKIDAFVGMVSEQHVNGSEFGSLQYAIWKDQFQRSRDGDRFFYENDAVLNALRFYLGIDFHHTLSEIITLNAGVEVEPDVFHISD